MSSQPVVGSERRTRSEPSISPHSPPPPPLHLCLGCPATPAPAQPPPEESPQPPPPEPPSVLRTAQASSGKEKESTTFAHLTFQPARPACIERISASDERRVHTRVAVQRVSCRAGSASAHHCCLLARVATSVDLLLCSLIFILGVFW